MQRVRRSNKDDEGVLVKVLQGLAPISDLYTYKNIQCRESGDQIRMMREYWSKCCRAWLLSMTCIHTKHTMQKVKRSNKDDQGALAKALEGFVVADVFTEVMHTYIYTYMHACILKCIAMKDLLTRMCSRR